VGAQTRPGEGVDAVHPGGFEQLRDEAAGRAGDEHRHPAVDLGAQLGEDLRPGRSPDDHAAILGGMPSFRNDGNVGAVEYRWDEQKAAALADEVDLLAYLSNLVGQDPTLTQPGGGNSSLKRRETDFAGRPVEVLRVKGSGTDLASITRTGFTGLRLEEL